jgi:hypothetical protein
LNLNLKNKIIEFSTSFMAYLLVIALFIIAIGLGYRGKYHLPSQTNWYVVFSGLIILLPFLIGFFIIFRKTIINNKKELTELVALKEKGIPKEIDLTQVEIIQNSECIAIGNEIIINKYGEKNLETKLIFCDKKVKYNYFFYTDINSENLKIYFVLNPKTYMYIDKEDKSKLYLNLDFLNA